jgi:hypothetical protein
MSGHDGLVANGYVWTWTSHCRDCGKIVLWYWTPNQKHVPLNPETYAMHFVTCRKRGKGECDFTAEDLEFLRAIKVQQPASAAKIKKSSTPGQCEIDFEEG